LYGQHWNPVRGPCNHSVATTLIMQCKVLYVNFFEVRIFFFFAKYLYVAIHLSISVHFLPGKQVQILFLVLVIQWSMVWGVYIYNKAFLNRYDLYIFLLSVLQSICPLMWNLHTHLMIFYVVVKNYLVCCISHMFNF
jgi:hypothetical protein